MTPATGAAPGSAEPAIEVRGVSRSFGGRSVLSDVSLTLSPGTCTAILGPSGSGKTTLLRIVAGLESADAGRVVLGGRVANDPGQRLPPEERGLGFLFQDLALWPHMSLRRNLTFVLEARGVPKDRHAAAVAQAAREAELPEILLDRRPAEVSGGERQRAALARLLVQEPVAALLDEPLSHLDPDLRGGLTDLLRRLRRERRLGMLLVTHDHQEAFALADRVLVLRNGRVEQEGTPAEVYLRPRTRFVATFVGRATILPAAREGDRISTPLGSFDAADAPSGPLLAVVRPEMLTLAPSDAAVPAAGSGVAAEGATGDVAARVTDAWFAGDAWLVTARIDGGATCVVVRSARPLSAGEPCRVRSTRPVFVPDTPEGSR